MKSVRLEGWLEKVDGIDEMGRVLTYGGAQIGHYFPKAGYVTIKTEYICEYLGAIKAIAFELGPQKATQAFHNTRIVR